MIAVLARAAALVERLAAAGADGIELRAIADRAGLPPATATRLLHDLCALGWADQDGPRGRYRLGPALEALSGQRPYHGRLAAAAAPVLRRLAARHRVRAVVAVLRRGRRVPLVEVGLEDVARLRERDDLWASASGRMLVAQLDWRARRRLVAAIGLPSATAWPAVRTWAELNAACGEARRRGWIEHRPRGPFVGIGLPLPDDEGVAALGVAAERERWDATLVGAARRAAQTIRRRMGG